nr:hypothetical protein [Bacteroidales bacterium]
IGVIVLFIYWYYVTIQLIAGNEFSDRASFNIVALSLLAIGIIPPLPIKRRHIELAFYGVLALSLINFFADGRSGMRVVELLRTGTGSAVSDAYNSDEGVIAPLFALFFYAAGGTFNFLAATFLMLLGGKRIAIAAFAGAVLAFWLFRAKPFSGMPQRFLGLLVVLGIINVLSVNLTALSELVYDKLDIEAHIEEVMLGRHNIGVALSHMLSKEEGLSYLLGSGPGASDATAMKVAELNLPHNDWLKIRVDYGLLGSIGATLLMAFFFSSSSYATALGVMTAIIMMTDNVLVYLLYQIPVIMTVSYFKGITSKSRNEGGP